MPCSLRNLAQALKATSEGQTPSKQPSLFNGSLLTQLLRNELSSAVVLSVIATLRAEGMSRIPPSPELRSDRCFCGGHGTVAGVSQHVRESATCTAPDSSRSASNVVSTPKALLFDVTALAAQARQSMATLQVPRRACESLGLTAVQAEIETAPASSEQLALLEQQQAVVKILTSHTAESRSEQSAQAEARARA